MSKPVVALVGRPNVGKSTLFNRLAGGRTAIVADVPGVTRDRLYRDAEWEKRTFTLVDTGGLFLPDPDFSGEVRKQVEKAIEEADVVVFVVDFRVGPTPEDEEIARLLHKYRKKVVLAVNKVDNFRRDSHHVYEFLTLGLGEPIPISALHGLNIDTLLSKIVEMFPPEEADEEVEGIRVAVVGRPNVGKSSLVNALLREERVIVSEVPGTTRDAIDTVLVQDDKRYIIVDTSGIRRKSRVTPGVERYSVIRALRAIDRADVVLLVLDAALGVVEQDKKIGGYIEEAGKGLIIIINKWDLVMEKTDIEDFQQMVRAELHFLSYAPLLFISALSGWGVDQVLGLVDLVASEQVKRISTGNLNNWLNEILLFNPPPSTKGKELKIYYAVQVGVKPPHFLFFVNDPDLVHFSYKRFLENQLRKTYGFEGTPLRLIFRRRRS
ncbi:MAG: GTPase Der [Thermoanaerobacterales bacterium 50_218]|nr:MAG: GTPase Der [Thermoanaerobacterales bacterium 50_218]HAA89493.1 ribosome biogenesis GTPase Der [Peptococcaceae bacterium]